MRILLVEDDRMIGEGLQKALKQNGCAVDWVEDGLLAEMAFQNHPYDIVILDLGLPNKSGISVLQDIRKSNDNTPILILTARDSVQDKVLGLDSGADDYMLKPFALEELEARIRMIVRRRVGQVLPIIKYGKISLNPVTREVLFQDQRVVLSGREYSLLYELIKNPSAILSRKQLEESLYGWNEEVASNAIEVHIHQIRKKMNVDVIKNVRNVGYTLQAEDDNVQ